MARYHRILSKILLLFTLVQFASASVIAKRSNIDIDSSTVTVQWASNNDRINNMRNYHIRTDGMIMESSKVNGGWYTNALGFKALAKGGGLTATVVKLSDEQNDVEIRLFYQDVNVIDTDKWNNSLSRMKSLVFKPSTGWQEDRQFYDNVGYIAYPSSAISWKDSAGITQYRLYSASADYQTYMSWWGVGASAMAALMGEELPRSVYVTLRSNTIFEAQFSSAPGAVWKLGNDNRGVAIAKSYDLSYGGSISAIVWKGGERISVFFWDADETYMSGGGELKETRWQPNVGWNVRPRPNVDFKDFNYKGALAAVTWVDGNNVDQIRLYARWYAAYGTTKKGYRTVELTADENGWYRQQEMPDVATAYERTKGEGWYATNPALDGVVWTYPDRGNVHIRLYTVRCGGKWTVEKACEGSSYTHELQFDTASGWKDGADIDR